MADRAGTSGAQSPGEGKPEEEEEARADFDKNVDENPSIATLSIVLNKNDVLKQYTAKEDVPQRSGFEKDENAQRRRTRATTRDITLSMDKVLAARKESEESWRRRENSASESMEYDENRINYSQANYSNNNNSSLAIIPSAHTGLDRDRLSTSTEKEDLCFTVHCTQVLLILILVGIIYLILYSHGFVCPLEEDDPSDTSADKSSADKSAAKPLPPTRITKKYCNTAPPDIISYGKLINIRTDEEQLTKLKFDVYTSLLYRCDDGYTMSPANSYVTCMEDGSWSVNIAPICTRKYKRCDQTEHANPYAKGGIEIISISAWSYKVYCDYINDGGGWIVFLRRFNGRENFFKLFKDYEDGFGEYPNEFWLGLKKLYAITNAGDYELRVDLEDFDGHQRYASYSSFKIGPGPLYELNVSGYSGDAGDSLQVSNGFPFSTVDKDQDGSAKTNCAALFQGAWWYERCQQSNLCGMYLSGPHDTYGDGMGWRGWRGYHYSLKRAEMKIRPRS